jgi:hypothetical protein
VRVRKQCRGTHAPAHLLREEGSRGVGADAAGKTERYVVDEPAAVYATKTSMNVFREANLGSTTDFDQRSATIDSIATHTDRSAPAITVDLHDSVEQFLNGTRTLLNPGLLIKNTEELRGLNNGNFVISKHSRHQLFQKVRTRTKIGVENGEEVSGCACERPTKVASFLEARTVLAENVVETIALSKRLYRFHGAIIHYMNLNFPSWPLQLTNVFVRVVEDLEWLFATRQVDIDSRTVFVVDRVFLENLLVGLEIPVLTAKTNGVGNDEVNLDETKKHTEPAEDDIGDNKEPHACGKTQEREDAEEVEQESVGVEIEVLLDISGSRGQNKCGVHLRIVGAEVRCFEAAPDSLPRVRIDDNGFIVVLLVIEFWWHGGSTLDVVLCFGRFLFSIDLCWKAYWDYRLLAVTLAS